MLVALGLLAVVVVLVAANALFVGVEFGYLTVDRNEVRALKEDGDTRATALDSSLAATSTNLSGAQLGITLSSLLVGYLTGPSVGELLTEGLGTAGMTETAARGTAMTAAFVLVTFLQMVFGELVPKNWAIAAPMRVARLVVLPHKVFMTVFGWLVTALNSAANAVLRALGFTPMEEPNDARTGSELLASARRSARQGSMDPHTADLLARSIAFGEHRASDAMLPRPLVTFLSGHSVQEMLEVVVETGHSRFPVVGDTVDDVVGVVHYRQALAVPARERATTPVRAIAVEAPVVSESMTLDPLLRVLRESPLQLVVVVDEYGGTAGILSFEDLVEELVGEIYDEQDEPITTHERLGEDEVRVGGLMRPDELGAILELELPDAEDTSTLTGLLSERLDRLPRVGDEIGLRARDQLNRDDDDLPTHARVHLVVESVEDNRVGSLRATAERGVDPAGSGDAPEEAGR